MNGFVVENGMLIRYDGMEKDIIIPEGVAIIGSYAFKISDNAFYGCTNLFEIVFPNIVEYIDYGAFANSGLASISFLEEVINIDQEAFKGCHDLTIKAPKASYAAKYAKENGITFEAID